MKGLLYRETIKKRTRAATAKEPELSPRNFRSVELRRKATRQLTAFII